MLRRPTESREHFEDERVLRLQERVRKVEAFLQNCPFLLGRPKTVQFSSGVSKAVNHGLGVPAACFVIRSSAAADIFETALQSGLDPAKQLALTSNADATVDLWFYPRASRVLESSGESR